MTKQEQIDELARAIYENYDCDGMRDGFCRGCGFEGDEMCTSRLCAKRLYNDGYRKEDKVRNDGDIDKVRRYVRYTKI